MGWIAAAELGSGRPRAASATCWSTTSSSRWCRSSIGAAPRAAAGAGLRPLALALPADGRRRRASSTRCPRSPSSCCSSRSPGLDPTRATVIVPLTVYAVGAARPTVVDGLSARCPTTCGSPRPRWATRRCAGCCRRRAADRGAGRAGRAAGGRGLQHQPGQRRRVDRLRRAGRPVHRRLPARRSRRPIVVGIVLIVLLAAGRRPAAGPGAAAADAVGPGEEAPRELASSTSSC